MNKYTDDELDREVSYLMLRHRGRAQAINRWDMVEYLFGVGTSYPHNDNNYADRRIRESIERLRQRMLICDMGDGNGRYLAANYAEYVEFRARYVSRAYPIMQTASAMDAVAREAFTAEYIEHQREKLQPSLFGALAGGPQ